MIQVSPALLAAFTCQQPGLQDVKTPYDNKTPCLAVAASYDCSAHFTSTDSMSMMAPRGPRPRATRGTPAQHSFTPAQGEVHSVPMLCQNQDCHAESESRAWITRAARCHLLQLYWGQVMLGVAMVGNMQAGDAKSTLIRIQAKYCPWHGHCTSQVPIGWQLVSKLLSSDRQSPTPRQPNPGAKMHGPHWHSG